MKLLVVFTFLFMSRAELARAGKADTPKAPTVETQAPEQIERTSKLERSIEEMKVEISNLRRSASKASGALAEDMNSQIASLEKDRAELVLKVKKLRAATGQAWEDIQVGIQSGMADISAAFKKAKTRLEADKTEAK